ncbi:MAG: hypothetical protein H0W83_11610, partial [Planctomycetes bacterium]|nr:hypothetical protein [Planctomycetota bacterium]
MLIMPGGVIRGVGMITAVGWSAHETAASVRAGICRCAEGGIDDLQGAPIVTAKVPDQDEDGWQSHAVPAGIAARESRLLRLAASAIREAASSAARPLPLVIGMPAVSMSDDQVLSALLAMTGSAIDVGASSVVRGGRSAGLSA